MPPLTVKIANFTNGALNSYTLKFSSSAIPAIVPFLNGDILTI